MAGGNRLTWECRECKSVEGVTRVNGRCRRCHLELTPKAVTGKAKKCAYCLRYVDSANCVYIKTRDAYYCGDECKTTEAKTKRASRKTYTGNSDAGSQTKSEPSDSKKSPVTEQISSVSPGQSSKAKFDRRMADRALAAEGLRLDESVWPEQVEDGVWKVQAVTYMVREPAGPRILEATSKGWRVDKQVKKVEYVSNDPLGGM